MAWCQKGNKPLPQPMMTQFNDVYVSLSLNESSADTNMRQWFSSSLIFVNDFSNVGSSVLKSDYKTINSKSLNCHKQQWKSCPLWPWPLNYVWSLSMKSNGKWKTVNRWMKTQPDGHGDMPSYLHWAGYNKWDNAIQKLYLCQGKRVLIYRGLDKWLTFCRRHFYMLFLERDFVLFWFKFHWWMQLKISQHWLR